MSDSRSSLPTFELTNDNEHPLYREESYKEIAADLKDGMAERETLDTFRSLLTSGSKVQAALAQRLARQATQELEKEHKLPGIQIVVSDKHDFLRVSKPGLELTTWDLRSDRVVRVAPLEGRLAPLVPALTDLINGKPLDTQSALILAKPWKDAADISSKALLWKQLDDTLRPHGASMYKLDIANVICGNDKSGSLYAYDLNTGKPRDLVAEVQQAEELERADKVKRAAKPSSWYERIKLYCK